MTRPPYPQYRWIVSQIGARQHYGVPRGFLYKSNLRHFYTDIWCRYGATFLTKLRSPRVRAFAKRWHAHLPSRTVTAFSVRSLLMELTRKSPDSIEALFEWYEWQGRWFAERVAERIAKLSLDPERDCFFGFDSACLETLEHLRMRAITTVVDQIDPGRTEQEIVLAETEKWPGWQHVPGRIPDRYFQRLDKEWATADLVLVNSAWSKSALEQQGVPSAKIMVVPLAYEPETVFVHPKPLAEGPLTVLWLGTVNLRKGIQYLIGAAKELRDTSVRIVVAGPSEISGDAMATAPANVQFVGRVTRDRTKEYYRQADVFVLPTMSDGFAITQVEAMGFGLPVITTPNCGEVVTDGVDGLIVPAGDATALAAAISRLDADRQLLRDMSAAALVKVGQFRLPNQADAIEAELDRFRRNRESGSAS